MAGITDKTVTSKYEPKSKNVTWIDMSSGSPVQKNFISGMWRPIGGGGEGGESTKLSISTSYSELKTLVDEGQLTPGTWYRITDYVCTTTQQNTQSANHRFDIIVRADDNYHLNENAFATYHEGDEYFADCKLETWELKYCLDNDSTRFAWADTTNGKGVIYYMKDEWNNECSYDFKNIMFRRWAIESYNACPSLEVGNSNNKNAILYGAKDLSNENVIEGATYGDINDWFYTFALKDISSGNWHDYSVVAHLGLKASDGTYVYCGDNRIGRKLIENNEDGCQQWLNNMVFFNCFSSLSQQNNDVFSPCYENIFGEGCESWTLGGNCCETLCDGLCKGITAGETFLTNKFGKYCASCCFGNAVQANDFGAVSMYNIFKGNVVGNTFGTYFISNTAGSVFETNKFGIYCEGNQFGDNTTSNCFGNNCSHNIAGDAFMNNEFGNNCNGNSFGFSCNSNSFGNYCQDNECGETVQNNTIKNNCRRISIGRYCLNITIFDGVQDCIITGNNSSPVRFAQVLNGVRGSSAANKLTITFEDNKNYTQVAAKTTDGTLKIFNPADLVP